MVEMNHVRLEVLAEVLEQLPRAAQQRCIFSLVDLVEYAIRYIGLVFVAWMKGHLPFC